LIWSMPMTKLSKQFELSDVGLRKICVKHQIPLPPQGHWTRKQFGKEVPRSEVPNKEINPRIEINNEYKTRLLVIVRLSSQRLRATATQDV
jgi:hypothetical protein